MAKVAINGMGRIGRAVFKIILETPQLELAAVNDVIPIGNLIYLLNYDSIYGGCRPPVRAQGDAIVIGERTVKVFNEKNPAALPWKDLGIDVVFECTGIFRDREGLQKHLEAGARQVILSAPIKDGGVEMVVHGVNRSEPDARMISCASCTTNCITPVVEIMDRRIGVKKAALTTIHAYTASQTIVDGPRNKWSRGRAAAVNFVPTSTGAAKATTKILPQYAGKFDGLAVRGPVPAGSLADMVFVVERDTNAAEVNQILREEAETERYSGIFGVTIDPIVSSDVIRDPRASVADLNMTQVIDGDLVKILSWYDNEWGYCSQMVREALVRTQ
jgi:glyceraldehyde 3-phosphate dehydrogenase